MRQMDGLTGYLRRRLELADMVPAILTVAHAHGDEQREQQIRGLLTRLAVGRFELAVIGQFSRGKTTLMNALLGGACLPTGALPMTSMVTPSATEAGLVRWSAATPPPCPWKCRCRGGPVRDPGERRADRMQVASVEVEIP